MHRLSQLDTLYLFTCVRTGVFGRRQELDPVLIAPVDGMNEARVGMRPEVVVVAPAVEVNAQLWPLDLHHCGAADVVVQVVARFQLHARVEPVRNHILGHIELYFSFNQNNPKPVMCMKTIHTICE